MDDRPSVVRQLAHELRDALSPIRSAVDLLRLRNFEADSARRTADKVDRGLDHALAAIDAFVIAEQCEDGSVPIDAAECSLEQIIGSARDTLGALFAARSQQCEFAPPPGGIAVRADCAKSRQIIAAMLEQASAAAPPQARIELQAGGAPPALRVRFPVAAGSAAAGCFESYRSRPRGSRMALRSARQLMVLQGGSLEVEVHESVAELIATFAASSAGVGAAPAASPAVQRAPAREAARPSGTHILIVDDSHEVRSIYKEALVALGYTVTEAANAEEALSTAAHATPDVALIDIHLPGMNGYRLAQSLRARSRVAVRLVMLSGMTLDDTTVRLSRNAGFDDCIDKAAGPKALHALLQAPAA
jgi:CheY-like chemotaxis protein